jgi:hypothetical protein
MVRRRVCGLLAGYADQNDHDTLRDDPGFMLVADRDEGSCHRWTCPANGHRTRDVLYDMAGQGWAVSPGRSLGVSPLHSELVGLSLPVQSFPGMQKSSRASSPPAFPGFVPNSLSFESFRMRTILLPHPVAPSQTPETVSAE